MRLSPTISLWQAMRLRVCAQSNLRRLILRIQLWLAVQRENELLAAVEGRCADGLTYRRLVEVGSRVNVLRDRLAIMDGREVHP